MLFRHSALCLSVSAGPSYLEALKTKIINYSLIIFQIFSMSHMQDPMISNPIILYIKPQTSKPIIIPAYISHKIIFMIIPLVIGLQTCPFLKKDIVLVSPAMNNIGRSAYSTTKPILYIKLSRCIHVLCTQNRSYPTLIVRYNANKVPMIKNEPIIAL